MYTVFACCTTTTVWACSTYVHSLCILHNPQQCGHAPHMYTVFAFSTTHSSVCMLHKCTQSLHAALPTTVSACCVMYSLRFQELVCSPNHYICVSHPLTVCLTFCPVPLPGGSCSSSLVPCRCFAPAHHVGFSRFVSAWPCPLKPFSSKKKSKIITASRKLPES
jgi:hypothetical protein